MDIDAFISANSASWDRLEALTRRAGRNTSRLDPEELDELVRLYQRVSTHLSTARTRLRDPGLTTRLTTLVARAGAVLYGTRPRTWRAFGRFVTDTFPAAVWHARAFMIASTLLFAIPATVIAVWLASSPVALEAAAPPAVREAYLTEDFESYYSSSPSAQFATEVTVNNIQVSIMAFAGGILLCVPTVLVMAFNGVNLGFAAGMFAAASEQAKFWGLILPHGMLELTAVFLAGGAGLRLGWTLIDPGDRLRSEALVEEGRRAIAVLIGLTAVFIAAGLIEGFVTGSPLSTWVRVGIGVVSEAVFLAYILVLGPRAARRGLTGALGEQREAGWAVRADVSARAGTA